MKLTLLKKIYLSRKALAIAAITLVAVSSSFYYFDILHVRYRNSLINLSPVQIKDVTKNILDQCFDLVGGKKTDCYKQSLVSLTKKYGISTSESILYTLQDTDATLRSCHVIAHYMSREAYERKPSDFYNLVDTLNVNSCGGGFLHGTLESYLGHGQSGDLTNAIVEDICGRGKDIMRQTGCAHLMGHIALINTYGNVKDALPLCESLRYQWHYMCYDGLFMEDHQKLALVEHGIMNMPEQNKDYIDKMESDCAKYNGVPLKACWKEMAEMYAHIYGYDPYRIWKECSKAPNNDLLNECYLKGAELMAMYPYYFDSAERITPICSFYSNSLSYNECTYRILSAMIYNSTKFITRGITLCNNIPQDHTGTCFNSLAQILTKVVPSTDKRKPLCGGLPESARSICYSR